MTRREIRRAQAGFTIVELMISLVIFSFAMAGVLAVASSMAQSYRDQRAAVDAQAAVRAPIDYLAEAIREASPGVPSGNIIDGLNGNTCGESPQAAALRVQNSYGAGTYAGTDLLDVIYASGGVVTALGADWDGVATSLTLVDTSQLATGDTVVIANLTQGLVVHDITVTGPTTATLAAAPACGAATYPAGSLVVRAQHAIFFIGQAPDGQPALMMNPTGDMTQNNTTVSEPLAEGIEDLQIALGVDSDGNGVVTTSPDEWLGDSSGNLATGSVYVPPSAFLRAVRVSLIAREQMELVGAPLTIFQRPALEDHTAGTFDQYPRRILQTTAEIRTTGASP